VHTLAVGNDLVQTARKAGAPDAADHKADEHECGAEDQD
jgi:hypothetical protein